MQTTREFEPADRYVYDWGICSIANGFAQVDTSQDASYYGTWANPDKLAIVNYCEGDVTCQIAETPAEFVAAIYALRDWANQMATNGFKGIDCGFRENSPIAARFKALGLGDLLH